jgi:hypothetical protein
MIGKHLPSHGPVSWYFLPKVPHILSEDLLKKLCSTVFAISRALPDPEDGWDYRKPFPLSRQIAALPRLDGQREAWVKISGGRCGLHIRLTWPFGHSLGAKYERNHVFIKNGKLIRTCDRLSLTWQLLKVAYLSGQWDRSGGEDLASNDAYFHEARTRHQSISWCDREEGPDTGKGGGKGIYDISWRMWIM